jgi:hypothetical protein
MPNAAAGHLEDRCYECRTVADPHVAPDRTSAEIRLSMVIGWR